MVKKSLLSVAMAALLISSVPAHAGLGNFITKTVQEVGTDVKELVTLHAQGLTSLHTLATLSSLYFATKGVVNSARNIWDGLCHIRKNCNDMDSLKQMHREAPKKAWPHMVNRAKEFGAALGCIVAYRVLDNALTASGYNVS